MSKKYIAQNNIPNFVYPNNKLAEYDVEIIHELKENSVSGTTSGFSILYDTQTGNINLSFTYQWYLNNAEPFISYNGKLNIMSVHLMTNEKKYYKPWNCIGLIQRDNTSLTYVTDTQNFTITPAMMEQSSFTAGKYYAEIRMIGHRAIYPINYSVNLTIPVTPTPTPTRTPSGPGTTPTPTPTPTQTQTPTPTNSMFYDIIYYDTTADNACNHSITAFPMSGNTTSYCTSTRFTNNEWLTIATGTYYLAYLGHSRTVTHTFGQNYADSIDAGCETCPAPPTPTPTNTPTQTGTPTPTPSSTPSGGGGSYNYYSITKYNCPGCTINTTGLFGRTTNPTTLTNGHYYNNGDGFVYLVNFGTAGPIYDVDLDGSASSGTSCPGTCAI